LITALVTAKFLLQVKKNVTMQEME